MLRKYGWISHFLSFLYFPFSFYRFFFYFLLLHCSVSKAAHLCTFLTLLYFLLLTHIQIQFQNFFSHQPPCRLSIYPHFLLNLFYFLKKTVSPSTESLKFHKFWLSIILECIDLVSDPIDFPPKIVPFGNKLFPSIFGYKFAGRMIIDHPFSTPPAINFSLSHSKYKYKSKQITYVYW